MARTKKPEEFTTKRGEIVEAALRLVFTRGFERMSIRDIQGELGISSGAFHHYFGSREALLQALIERMGMETQKPMQQIIQDPNLNAIQKLQGFFDTLDRLRMGQQANVAKLLHIWYTDDNALVRLKVDEAIFQQRTPLIGEIVRQGVREGCFDTAHPDLAGEVILSLLRGMGDTHARLLLALTQAPPNGGAADTGYNEAVWIEKIVATHAAYMDAIERVLGAPTNSLYRSDAGAVKVWAAALRADKI